MVIVSWLMCFTSIHLRRKIGLSQVRSKLAFKKMRLFLKELKGQKVLDFKEAGSESKFLVRSQRTKTIL